MFLVTIFCFLVGLLHWTTQLSSIVILVRTALVETLDLSLQDRALLANHRVQVPNLIVAWSRFLVRFFFSGGNSLLYTQPLYFQPVVSDAVVVWRAWVLFTDERWMLAFPILLLTATTGKIPASPPPILQLTVPQSSRSPSSATPFNSPGRRHHSVQPHPFS